MKITIVLSILILISSSCRLLKSNASQSCGQQLSDDLKKNWLRIKDYSYWNPDVSFERNDDFIERVKTIYKRCLLNKSKTEIESLFGKTLYVSKYEVGYDCVPPRSKNIKEKICLRFVFNDEGNLVEIISPECWTPID